MKKAALHNLGCKVNEYETESMRELLEKAGYEIVPFDMEADVYVVNTCTVTAIADKKSRQMLRRARRLNPNAVIVAAGCFVETMRGRMGEESAVHDMNRSQVPGMIDHTTDDEDGVSLADIYIGNRSKDKLVDEIDAFLKDRRSRWKLSDINDKTCGYDMLTLDQPKDRTRAFLKVQDGCNRFCSYCKIPYARGRAVSRDINDAVDEAEQLAESGFREIVLTGIHLSSYEIDGQNGLLDLIARLQDIEKLQRIRLGSLEPVVVTEDFAKRLSSFDKLCPHFHLSLQSGCDRTLKDMNRRYTAAEFAESVGFLRRAFDDPAITTDVIAGFPGETEEDFEETLEFVRRMDFYEMHVFPYSKREGTKAAKMPGHLDRAVREARAARLIEAANEMSEGFRNRYIGRQAEVLIEEEIEADGQMVWAGFTREYIRVEIPSLNDGRDHSGEIISGKLTGPLNEGRLKLEMTD